ncbi:MAG: hypothetical protein ACOZQL_11345 [Myxococcota bacterium]
MDAQKLIERLKGEGATSLAALSIDATLTAELGTLLPRELLVSTARSALGAWLASDGGTAALGRVVEALASRLQAEKRAARDVVAKDMRVALREIVGRPFSPDRRLVLTVIDREPTRELVRQLLLDAVLEFGRRASAPVAGVARGLGSLAKLAGETVKAKSGGLGSLVGAVSGEVERQLEKRAVEFVDAALGGVFGQIADSISDPRRASEAAELRMAVFDGAMELTGPQLARELINLDVPGGAGVLRQGLERWLASPEADRQLEELATFLLERDAKRPVREVLAEVGLLDVVRSVAIEQLARRIQAIAALPAFEQWLASES